MKTILFSFFIITALSVKSQPHISLKKSSPDLKLIVEQVARDYYLDFDNIKGDTISQSENTIEFTSKLSPSNAISTSITKYINPYSYTWEVTMFQSENYEEAIQKYKKYYKQLNGCKLTFYDKTSYKLAGNYDTPTESRAFASSMLQLDAVNHDLELFKVEIGLTYLLPEWTVKVLVYEKVSDEKIRPTIIPPSN